jgi:hypothetical protein
VRTRLSPWTLVPFLFLFPCIFVSAAPKAFGQQPRQTPTPPALPAPNPNINPPMPDDRARIEAEMAKKAAKERAAALKSDAEKLLKLSVELKQSVDKADENVLSLDVIKKAEEIEKLARSVREKMKGPS